MNRLEIKSLVLQKQNLKLFMKQWLPILQGDFDDLDSYLTKVEQENPYLNIKKHFSQSSNKPLKNSISDKIELLSISKASLYDKLLAQIEYPLFPTPISKKVAKEIILNINEEGYFDANLEEIAQKFNLDIAECEKIRLRFAYLEPIGVGAVDLKESFNFQLDDLLNDTMIEENLLKLLHIMIDNFEKLEKYADLANFSEAKSILKKFKNPPALEFMQSVKAIIPEVYVGFKNDEINIKINNNLYPDINIKGVDSNEEFAKEKLREARNIEKLLELRKHTIYKVTLSIIEKQLKFFYGGELMPLKMQDIADELEFNESTISRAISHKYLECDRGVFALKFFFSNEISNNISSSEVKSFILNLVKYEDRKAPLTDVNISKLIEQRYRVKLIRRSVTKYRQELNIASSVDRKKLYLIEDG